MIVETVFSMMSLVYHTNDMRHRVWDGFEAKWAYTVAAFNILAQWNDLQPDDQGRIHLSIHSLSTNQPQWLGVPSYFADAMNYRPWRQYESGQCLAVAAGAFEVARRVYSASG